MRLTYQGIQQMCSFADPSGKIQWEGTLVSGRLYDDLPYAHPRIQTLIAGGLLAVVDSPAAADDATDNTAPANTAAAKPKKGA